MLAGRAAQEQKAPVVQIKKAPKRTTSKSQAAKPTGKGDRLLTGGDSELAVDSLGVAFYRVAGDVERISDGLLRKLA